MDELIAALEAKVPESKDAEELRSLGGDLAMFRAYTKDELESILAPLDRSEKLRFRLLHTGSHSFRLATVFVFARYPLGTWIVTT
jgi:hypothetical protein